MATKTPLNQLDEVRARMPELESKAVYLDKADAKRTMDVITLLDAFHAKVDRAEADGARVGPERNRLHVVEGRLDKVVEHAASVLGRAGIDMEARRAEAESPDGWWWEIPALATARRRKRIRDIIMTVVAVIVIGFLAVIAYRLFFAPDPETLARVGKQNAISEALQEGDLERALEVAEEGITEHPREMSFYLWKSALLEKMGGPEDEIKAALEAGREEGPEYDFFLNRAEIYLSLGMNEEALATTKSALEAMPDDPYALLLSGDAHRALGDMGAALEAYYKVGEVADNSDQDAGAVVLSRLRISEIMQGGGVMPQ